MDLRHSNIKRKQRRDWYRSIKDLVIDPKNNVSKHEEPIHQGMESTSPLEEEGDEETKAKEASEEGEVKEESKEEVEASIHFEMNPLTFVESFKQEHHLFPPLSRGRKPSRDQRKK